MHVDLPKRTINQFKPDQQSRRHELKADCPNIYTMLQPKSECTFFENETLAIYSYSSSTAASTMCFHCLWRGFASAVAFDAKSTSYG